MTPSPFHPGAWPGLDAPHVLLSVSHWPFGPTLIVLSVLVCDREGREAERHSILWCLARAGGPGLQSGGEGDDSGCKLWQVTHKNTQEHWYWAWCYDTAAPTVTHLCTHEQNPILIQANAPHIQPPAEKGLMQLFPNHTWDLNTLTQSGAVRFYHPTDLGFIWFALVCCISGCGPLFCPWAGTLLGIRMCQIKCCGYLSHNCYESGNTLFLELG